MGRRLVFCNLLAYATVVALGGPWSLWGSELPGDVDASVVQTPETTSVNDYYVNNRQPLRQNALIKLPVGSVKATGWLGETLHRQRSGLAGHLSKISAWLQKDDNAWLSPGGKGKMGWEEVPYWLKGYIGLAYALDDESMQKEAHHWVNAAIASSRPDGNFGPLETFDDGSQDFWPNMVMLDCLQTYYERSGDQRVLELMTKYFRHQLNVSDDKFLTNYWQRMRGGDNLRSVYWLYNRTGDEWLLDLAHKIHRRTADWTRPDGLPDWHNVNVAQAFGEPATYFLLSGDQEHLHSAYRNFDLVRKQYGQVPGGMFGADENARPGHDDPRQAIETCGMVEQMRSDEELMRITGDLKWADHAELVAFNSLPAAFTEDFRALRYLTSPNMVSSDRHNHAPGFQNGGPMTMMNPLSHRCCQHNHIQGWPYFVESLWAATCDNGLCAMMFGPSIVKAKVGDGTEVTVTAKTRYPFEEQVDLTLESPNQVKFPLYIRVPSWCDRCTVAVNGATTTVEAKPSCYVRLERIWHPNDSVTVQFPMDVRIDVWRNNHQSVSVSRGPLTYSLQINEKTTRFDARETALHDSKWQDSVDFEAWPAYEITPTTPWNYGLLLPSSSPETAIEVHRRPWPEDDFPFTHEGAPIRLTCRAKRIPEWKLDRYGLCAPLQDSPVASDEPDEQITLVPMGAARLRITAFPVIGDGADAHRWHAPVRPKKPRYRITASHCFDADSIDAVADGLEPASSADRDIPRHTFWPRKSSNEWLQADFDAERKISKLRIYWYDDRSSGGECRTPQEWRVYYRDGDEWLPVKTDAAHGIEMDRYDLISFDPVTTRSIRVEVQLQDKFSAGVLEWKIE